MPRRDTPRLSADPAPLRLYTRREAAARLGISVRTIRDAIKAGLIREHHVGIGTGRPTYRITEAELYRFIEARTAALGAERES